MAKIFGIISAAPWLHDEPARFLLLMLAGLVVLAIGTYGRGSLADAIRDLLSPGWRDRDGGG